MFTNTSRPDPIADLNKAVEDALPPKKPGAVQVAENSLKTARENRAAAEGRHTASIHARDSQGRTIATGSTDFRLPAEQRAAAEALADAGKVAKAARLELKEARDKWRPGWRKAVEPVAEQAEALLRDGLVQVDAASAALTALYLEAERHGGMPKPGLIYQAREIAFALDGLKRALKRG